MERRIERPALLTRMSTAPCSLSTVAISASHEASSARSAVYAQHLPPPAMIWSRVLNSSSSPRATMRVLAPASAILNAAALPMPDDAPVIRSEEHTSELQSLMRISYAVFCLKKKNQKRM